MRRPVTFQTHPLAPLVFREGLPHGNWYWCEEDESLWFARGNEKPILWFSWKTPPQ